MKYLRLIASLLFLLFPVFAWGAYFFSVTDVHFDPFDTCATNQSTPCPIIFKLTTSSADEWPAIFEQYASKTLPSYGHGTNYTLLKSSLNELKTVQSQWQPKFILLIGDYLAHDYKDKYVTYSGDTTPEGYQSFVQKTIQFLTNEFHAALPTIPIYPVIGNNDSYQGDYYSNPKGAFYRDMTNTCSVFFINPQNQARFHQTFPDAGYYEIIPPESPNDKILVLNSVLFSEKAQGVGVSDAAQQELSWLTQTLSQAEANQQRVWLVFHIPMGIDVYKTVTSGTITPLWKTTYLQDFLSILSRHAPIITGIFTSHIHMDNFAIYKNNANEEIFDSTTPAISPQFGNNSGFKVFQYDENNFTVNNFITYYLPISKNTSSTTNSSWKILYNFNDKYQPKCTNCLLINGMNLLQKANPLVSVFKDYYAVGNPTGQPIQTDPNAWPYYWCAIHYFTISDYEACLAAQNRPN